MARGRPLPSPPTYGGRWKTVARKGAEVPMGGRETRIGAEAGGGGAQWMGNQGEQRGGGRDGERELSIPVYWNVMLIGNK